MAKLYMATKRGWDGKRIVEMYGDDDLVAMTGQRLINGVIHHFKHHVMQSGAIGSVSDVHTGAFAYSFESLKLLNTGLVVGGIRRDFRNIGTAKYRLLRATFSHCCLRSGTVEVTDIYGLAARQIRIGMTTYLKRSLSGRWNRALELASARRSSMFSVGTLFRTSSK